MQQSQGPPLGGRTGNFQPPPNMPNINFSAPVIRLGTSGPSKPGQGTGGATGGRREGGEGFGSGHGRPGLGASHHHGGHDQQRQHMRENMVALVPPTKEEIARTIFIGKITDNVIDDEGIEKILRSAGNLRRWYRAADADGKKASFGFAEYDDALSLEMAVEILKDVRIPKKKKIKQEGETNGDQEDDEMDSDERKLLVMVDENSLSYLEQYHASRGVDPATAQSRLDAARQALSDILSEMANPSTTTTADVPAESATATTDPEGDTTMTDGEKKVEGVQGEVVTIPLTTDDELSDIPAEMREMVAKEIAAFRDRSNRRDMERLKREEELEALEKKRNMSVSGGGTAARHSRLASPPPPTAPSGPAGGANGIPLGPRDRGLHGVPSGPKGFQTSQQHHQQQKAVSFVNGTNMNGSISAISISREDEDDSASDEELERRKRSKREAELEKLYLDQERRWLNRERSRTAAVEREKARDKDDEARREREKEAVAKRLKEWDDDVEASRRVEEYYVDRSMWIRNRASFRAREAALDESDRAAEDRERDRDHTNAKGMAEQFLARQADEMMLDNSNSNDRRPSIEAAPGPGQPGTKNPQQQPQQKFKLSLGAAAAQKAQAQAAANSTRRGTTRTVAEVEGLLEDEESSQTTTKRTLIPIQFDPSTTNTEGIQQDLTSEERDEAIRRLAQEIPSDKEGLWKWPVRWDFVDEQSVIIEKLRPFVEKKIVEYLGVQEQMLVEVVEEHLKKKGGAGELVEMLEGALDEEAEALVKKLWRMMIFFSESERKGLSA
ncbi:MAG: hypothetical protein M1823_000066 [Watsoniomyces obsoletus]|nr:MAG: hypothetical protein M1823_000066 [Watsoniomyces obsoletus]